MVDAQGPGVGGATLASNGSELHDCTPALPGHRDSVHAELGGQDTGVDDIPALLATQLQKGLGIVKNGHVVVVMHPGQSRFALLSQRKPGVKCPSVAVATGLRRSARFSR